MVMMMMMIEIISKQAKGSTRDLDSTIMYGSNSKVTTTKSNKT